MTPRTERWKYLIDLVCKSTFAINHSPSIYDFLVCILYAGNKHVVTALEEVHSRVARGLKGPHNIFECRRSNILGTLVQDASPFLFPCTIEYSLICAAILYVMWRNISRPEPEPNEVVRSELHPFKRSPHHYSVDCAGAHKGLFIGILMLVLTIISLILFFVLISKPEFTNFAVTEVNICELTLYGTTTVATLVGMIQVRTLHYDSMRNFSLGLSIKSHSWLDFN